MVVGGTGLYVDALTRGFVFPEHASLSAEWQKQPLSAQVRALAAHDPHAVETIDTKNPRRVVRALGYVLATGKLWSEVNRSSRFERPTLRLVIDRPRDELFARINARVRCWPELGLFNEVSRLLDRGVSIARMNELGQVYRAATRVVAGDWTERTFVDRLQQELRQYARRQLAWWRRSRDVHWVSTYSECNEMVHQWLSQRGSW